MEFFRFRRDIPFMRHALVFNIVSAVTFLAAVFFLVTRGLHFSIEFTGGVNMQASYAQAAEVEKIRSTVEKLNYGEVLVQPFGSSRDVMIRLPLANGMKQTEVVASVFDS
ncbi:MAG: protein translocase subunit SecF, partial [Rhizobacter sp.]